MTKLVITAAPDRVFLRYAGMVLEMTPVEARRAARVLLNASNDAVSAYDGAHLATVIKSWKPDA